MGNSLSKYHDDYEDYQELCAAIGVTPVPMSSQPSFYKHFESIQPDKVNTVTDAISEEVESAMFI